MASATDEGLVDMVTQYFKGVGYTAPTWYYGLGFDSNPGGYGVDPDITNTAARLTPGAENFPVTDNFSDDVGSRLALDFTLGATGGANVVSKVTPPIANFTSLVVAPNTDMCYIVSSAASSPAPPPAILLEQFPMTRNLEPLPVPGDFFEVTITIDLLLA